MFLIFRLGRPDLLPIHDLGVKKAGPSPTAKSTCPSQKSCSNSASAGAPTALSQAGTCGAPSKRAGYKITNRFARSRLERRKKWRPVRGDGNDRKPNFGIVLASPSSFLPQNSFESSRNEKIVGAGLAPPAVATPLTISSDEDFNRARWLLVLFDVASRTRKNMPARPRSSTAPSNATDR